MPFSHILTFTESVAIATNALRRLIKPSALRAMQLRSQPSSASSIPQQRLATSSLASGIGAANSFVPGTSTATPVLSYTRSVSNHSNLNPAAGATPRLRRQSMPLTREQVILGRTTAPHPQLNALKQQQ